MLVSKTRKILRRIRKITKASNDNTTLLQLLKTNVNQGVWVDAENQKLFYEAEKQGVHILPCHFYSPVPNTSELTDAVWQDYDAADLRYDENAMLSLLQDFHEYKHELTETPFEQKKKHEYFINNTAFNGTDAFIYYYMIRHFKPKKLIEIGSGYSTLIASKACLTNSTTDFIAVEPYPPSFLETSKIKGLTEFIPKFIQDVPVSFFEENLNEGDILFIDSSHVSKVGSDVNYIILRILPKLKKGVIIHFHDIFLPSEVQKEWVESLSIFWNEQYLLHALLIANGEYKTIMPNAYMGLKHTDALKKVMPVELPYYYGGSYWLRKGV